MLHRHSAQNHSNFDRNLTPQFPSDPSVAIGSIQVNASVSTGCACPSVRASHSEKIRIASILERRTDLDATIFAQGIACSTGGWCEEKLKQTPVFHLQ